jgi:NADH-quinone oxidoreductase subunit G
VGDARPDWQILAQLGERVGLSKPPFAPALAFKELAAAVPQYKEMDYRSLARVEEQWPIIGRSDLYYGGTAYDNRWGLGRQWAAAAETGPVDSYELPVEIRAAPATPFGALNIMHIPALYTPGTLINRTVLLKDRMARPTLFLNEADATVLMVNDGDAVDLHLGSEAIPVEAVVGSDTPAGLGLLRGVSGAQLHGVFPATVTVRPVDERVAV